MSPALFSYKKGNTPLHRLSALAKLVFQFAICMAIFASPTFPPMQAAIPIFCGGVVAIAFVVARISLLELRRLRLILVLGAVYALFRVFAIAPDFTADAGFKLFVSSESCIILFSFIELRTDRVLGVLFYIYRFFIAALSALVFFKTTSPLQVKEAFETLQEALAKIFPPLRRLNPALTLALAINFIPEIFSAWGKISRAAKARKPKGTAFFMGSFYAELFALFSCLVCYAETTRRALANRLEEKEG